MSRGEGRRGEGGRKGESAGRIKKEKIEKNRRKQKRRR